MGLLMQCSFEVSPGCMPSMPPNPPVIYKVERGLLVLFFDLGFSISPTGNFSADALGIMLNRIMFISVVLVFNFAADTTIFAIIDNFLICNFCNKFVFKCATYVALFLKAKSTVI